MRTVMKYQETWPPELLTHLSESIQDRKGILIEPMPKFNQNVRACGLIVIEIEPFNSDSKHQIDVNCISIK